MLWGRGQRTQVGGQGGDGWTSSHWQVHHAGNCWRQGLESCHYNHHHHHYNYHAPPPCNESPAHLCDCVVKVLLHHRLIRQLLIPAREAGSGGPAQVHDHLQQLIQPAVLFQHTSNCDARSDIMGGGVVVEDKAYKGVKGTLPMPDATSLWTSAQAQL